MSSCDSSLFSLASFVHTQDCLDSILTAHGSGRKGITWVGKLREAKYTCSEFVGPNWLKSIRLSFLLWSTGFRWNGINLGSRKPRQHVGASDQMQSCQRLCAARQSKTAKNLHSRMTSDDHIVQIGDHFQHCLSNPMLSGRSAPRRQRRIDTWMKDETRCRTGKALSSRIGFHIMVSFLSFLSAWLKGDILKLCCSRWLLTLSGQVYLASRLLIYIYVYIYIYLIIYIFN